jgi:short-subunit dehydrogenase
MQVKNKRILVTGAAGGIGQELAKLLAAKGAFVALLGRHIGQLDQLVDEIKTAGGKACSIACDLSHQYEVEGVMTEVFRQLGGLDVLINNAGVLDFTEFEQQSAEKIAVTLQVNTIAPMQLVNQALPVFKAQGYGVIVNIGSVFGAIGFPHYVTYSASKFALRGFSESLRRELEGTGLQVIYVAPRATSTSLNSADCVDLMKSQGTKIDAPTYVAERIVSAIESGQREVTIGQPEGFFSKLNAILPRLVDKALARQTKQAKQYL